jgi:hypothetical protein
MPFASRRFASAPALNAVDTCSGVPVLHRAIKSLCAAAVPMARKAKNNTAAFLMLRFL